jgi:hypothetical protein
MNPVLIPMVMLVVIDHLVQVVIAQKIKMLEVMQAQILNDNVN